MAPHLSWRGRRGLGLLRLHLLLLHLLGALFGDDDVALLLGWALSSTDFSASDQVWPAALQEQAGLNSARNLNAVGSAV